MVYHGTTICKNCKSKYEFECGYNDGIRRQKGATVIVTGIEYKDHKMHYEYTDEAGTPHFSGNCPVCDGVVYLTDAEAVLIPRECYSSF